MTLIILTNCPPGLRGYLTRWLLEIAPGVFLGNVSARIRDTLWSEVAEYANTGRALLAHSTNTEQGYTFRTLRHSWHPTDHEGLTLMRRPSNPGPAPTEHSPPPPNWSNTAKRRRYGR